ncbi:gagpol and env protein precursor [Aphelenchoides avenae]|nr:gagpol and env protein precursor [Aphelenchus avenae]
MNVISHSSSEYSSPVVLVRKKDGSLRMCIDYRKLNRAIKLSQWPMPNIDVMLQSLAGKKFFTTCDLHSGYWQIPLTERAKEFTAFSTMGGHYHFNVLPFSLSTAPGQLERAMEKLFAEDLGKRVYIYLDDILIATDSLKEHFEVLERVFQKLCEYNLRLKPSKCAFLTTETEFLGHVISSEGLKTDHAKIEKILNFPSLRDVTKADGWQWTDREQNSFDEMKGAMTSPPVLIQPDIESAMNGTRPFLLYTDASKDGVGAVLSQLGSDGKEHPIAFASICTPSAESKYAISALEALALVYALRKFKYFVSNAHIIVRTDHQPLVYLFKQSNLSNRLLRWADKIQPYCNDDKLKIEYIKGEKNRVADSLSRNCVPDGKAQTLRTRATADIMSGVFFEDSDAQLAALNELGLVLEAKRLAKMMPSGRVVPVVPARQARSVYDQYHSGLFGGHSGLYKTIQLMEKYVYWPKMRQDIRKWSKECFTCARLNKKRVSVPPLKPIIAHQPYETVGIDVFSLSQTSSGNAHAITVIDLHSKFCRAYPVADKTAATIAKCLWEKWSLEECRKPVSILSDRGGEFVNEIIAEIAKVSGIDQKLSVGHNPRENGCTERMNQTLKALLMKMEDSALEWDQRLPYALQFYNCCPHSTTGESPYFLLHGADPSFVEFAKPSVTVSKYTVDDDSHKMNFARGMKRLHELVTERIESKAAAMNAYYDKQNGVVKTSFRESDRVLDIHGTLLDFNANCSCHKHLKLSLVMGVANVPACADLWVAKTQGLQVAECLQMTSESRALYFNNNSPLASVSSYAKPTEASVIRVMSALAGICSKRRQAFVDAAFKQLTCSPLIGVEKAALMVSIAERVRADLDGKKSLRSDAVIVLGGHNAEFLSNVLSATFVEAATVPELRQFFEGTHLQAAVQRIFVWLDLDNEQVKLAQQSQLVPALYSERHRSCQVEPRQLRGPSGALWLSDAERADGARFAHSLGSNALVTDFTAVDERGYVSHKSARAALRFIRAVKPNLVPEQVDLSDPPSKQQRKASSRSLRRHPRLLSTVSVMAMSTSTTTATLRRGTRHSSGAGAGGRGKGNNYNGHGHDNNDRRNTSKGSRRHN